MKRAKPETSSQYAGQDEIESLREVGCLTTMFKRELSSGMGVRPTSLQVELLNMMVDAATLSLGKEKANAVRRSFRDIARDLEGMKTVRRLWN